MAKGARLSGCSDTPLDGSTLRRTIVEAMSPITANEDKAYMGNSFVFHNKGNTEVCYDDNWTIAPGEFMSVGNPGTYDVIDQNFNFKFGLVNVLLDGDPPTNKLEVLRMYYIISA